MIGFFKKLWRDKRGNALVIAAAALPLVLGSAGLASDTIQWALWKRQLQRAADSAAIAGVYANVQSAISVTDAVNRDLSFNISTSASPPPCRRPTRRRPGAEPRTMMPCASRSPCRSN